MRHFDRAQIKANTAHHKIKTEEGEKEVPDKMDRCQTFFALCKSYCSINVLLIPKSFHNGGYLLSPIAIVIGGLLQAICAVKLSQCALAIKKASYSDIAK